MPAEPEPILCVMNLGRSGRRLRRDLGVVSLVLAAGLVAALVALHAPRSVRLTAFLPFWAGIVGLLQAREAT